MRIPTSRKRLLAATAGLAAAVLGFMHTAKSQQSTTSNCPPPDMLPAIFQHAVGSGTVDTEHGVPPVPAPATARLLYGKPVYSRGPAVELTTPTGAALASTFGRKFRAASSDEDHRVRLRGGDRDFPEHANVLRAIIGEAMADGRPICG